MLRSVSRDTEGPPAVCSTRLITWPASSTSTGCPPSSAAGCCASTRACLQSEPKPADASCLRSAAVSRPTICRPGRADAVGASAAVPPIPEVPEPLRGVGRLDGSAVAGCRRDRGRGWGQTEARGKPGQRVLEGLRPKAEIVPRPGYLDGTGRRSQQLSTAAQGFAEPPKVRCLPSRPRTIQPSFLIPSEPGLQDSDRVVRLVGSR